MKVFVSNAATVIVLWLAGFFGSPFLINMSSSYLERRLGAISAADGLAPRTSLAFLLVACSISAGLLFWFYVRWYRKSSIWIYFGMLVTALVLASVGIGLNLVQLQTTLKDYRFPTHSLLNMGSLAYFDWGAWPIIVVAIIALAVMFFLQPEDLEGQEKSETDSGTPAENVDQS
jgi:hypothetical protein